MKQSTLERVTKTTRHPFKGLVTVLVAVVAYLALLVAVTIVANFVMS